MVKPISYLAGLALCLAACTTAPKSPQDKLTVNDKKIKIMYTRPLEDDPRLADLVIAKADEFLSD